MRKSAFWCPAKGRARGDDVSTHRTDSGRALQSANASRPAFSHLLTGQHQPARGLFERMRRSPVLL